MQVVSYSDRALNYAEVDGKITSAQVDCFVKGYNHQLNDKGTTNLAYMDCSMAPLAAAHFGYSASDVQKHIKLTYSFKSPVDGSVHEAKYAENGVTEDYKVGETVKVYANTSDPALSRWN
jgi:hypothetical protein